ncbi:MAG: homoserine dehydrogenase [Clostridia bacterium]|nr:homoserine dehydrogenase [Clostridia bacterium]
MIQIAVLGHGVVGSGVVEVLGQNAAHIAHKAGEGIEVKRILDLRSFPDLPYADRFTTSFDDIVNDADIRIVVETMGGLHPAYDYVKAALENGKSVVTSNKELVAAKGDELLAIAKKNNLNFLFEASVGGGIPILRPLDQCLSANNVTEIAGILNGTTNFMLTRMLGDNMDFDEALALAQSLGYAERDPSADVDGHDACRKICILASLAFGKHVYPDQVHTEGIRNLTLADVAYAAACDSVIKLIGRVVVDGDKVHSIVAPMMVPNTCLLSGVSDVFNAVMVRGDAVGDTVFYGRGAGKLPTASAVVADVIDEVKHFKARKYLYWEQGAADYVLPAATYTCRSLLRVKAADGLLENLSNVQVVTYDGAPADELAVLTEPMTEDAVDALIRESGATLINRIRMMDL